MLKRVFLTLTVTMFAAFAPLTVAQVRDFGELEMNSIEAREAGIGSIRLVREGLEDNQAEWVLNVDVFNLEGHTSGAIEVRYPDLDVMEVDFAPADSDETYRIRVDEVARTFRIEHVGVEIVTFRTLCDPKELTVQGKQYSPEELEELRQQQFECSKQVEVTGTSKSWLEAQAQYKEITRYLAAVNIRLRTYFGIPTKGQREALEELERVKRETRETQGRLEQDEETTGQMSRSQSLPQNLIRCPPEEQPFCPVGNNNFAVLGEGSCFLCSQSVCCTEASIVADVDCQLNTRVGCCANTLCQVTSLSDCGIWCACQLVGYFWGCRPCD